MFTKTKGGVNERRKKVIQRLEQQLKKNKKKVEDKDMGFRQVEMYEPLTDTDKIRIEKEIIILKARIL